MKVYGKVWAQRLTWPWRPLQRQLKSSLQFPIDYECMDKHWQRRTGLSKNKSLTLPNEYNPTQTGLIEFRVGYCEGHRKLGAMCRGYPMQYIDWEIQEQVKKGYITYKDSIHRSCEIGLEQTINDTLHVFDVCSRQLIVIIVRSEITSEDREGLVVPWKYISNISHMIRCQLNKYITVSPIIFSTCCACQRSNSVHDSIS